jgi:hypothetical protein
VPLQARAENRGALIINAAALGLASPRQSAIRCVGLFGAFLGAMAASRLGEIFGLVSRPERMFIGLVFLQRCYYNVRMKIIPPANKRPRQLSPSNYNAINALNEKI